MSLKKIKQEFEEAYKKAANMLRVHEQIWQEEWKAAPNPFVAVKTWNYKKNVKRRLAIINPWIEARNKLDKSKENT
jgi:hypothetical protein